MMKRICRDCNFFKFCDWVKSQPHYREYRILKNKMLRLPRCFEATPLGEPKGIRQFRGPYGSHIHEYEKHWILHRDRVDPRLDPIGHLVNDAPHILALCAISFLALLFFGLASRGEKA